MPITYTWDHLRKIRQYPHLLGHLMGKDKLTPMHSEWIKYIWTHEGGTKTLMGHRGSFKSTSLIDVGIPWWLLFNPSDRVALVRKTYTSGADELRTIASLMQLDSVKPLFSLAWGVKDWKFSIQRTGKLELSVKASKTKEASIEALGLDSSIVSKHYDFVVMDDVSDIKDRQSAAERDKTKLIVSEIRTNIIDRGKPVRVFGTPWHRNDVFEDLPTPRKYPISVTGLISDDERSIIMSSTPPTQYAINYELTFQNDTDNLFNDPHYDTWDFAYKSETIAHIDAAYGGKDRCSLTIMKPLANNRIAAVGFAEKCHIKDWIPFVTEKLLHYRAKKLFMETNSDRGFSLEAITTSPEAVAAGIWAKPYAEYMQKEDKIAKYLYEGWNRIAWAPETDPSYMEEVIDWTVEADSFDDCCFEGSTLIQTDKGNVSIKDIKAGDKVWTPFGYRRVTFAGQTGTSSVIENLGLVATKDHKVYNKTVNAFVPLGSLSEYSDISKLTYKEMLEWQMLELLISMEAPTSVMKRASIISARQKITMSGKALSSCIGQCGNFITEKKYLKAMKFITLILIRIIMTSLTYLRFRGQNIAECTRYYVNKILRPKRLESAHLRRHRKPLRLGIQVLKDWLGTRSTPQNLYRKMDHLGSNANVSIVERNILPSIYINGFAQISAETEIGADSTQRRLKCAENVGKNTLWLEERAVDTTVPSNAKPRPRLNESIPVYNLTVENMGCYYANGILVSNCDSAASLLRESGLVKKRNFRDLYKW